LGTVVNIISSITLLDELIGLKIDLNDLDNKMVLDYFDDYKE